MGYISGATNKVTLVLQEICVPAFKKSWFQRPSVKRQFRRLEKRWKSGIKMYVTR
jgi:hypothetical protein